MNELERWRKRLAQHLESLQRAGVTHLPKVEAPPAVAAPSKPTGPARSAASAGVDTHRSAAPSIAWIANAGPSPPAQDESMARRSSSSSSRSTPPSRPSATPDEPPRAPRTKPSVGEPALGRDQREAALAELCGDVRRCRLCPMLVANRTQTVFGVGNIAPRLCFFGEAPGADEDRQGEPFVGRAGQLLDKMIAAMTLRREDVYILNVLKCRPPDNRPPTPEEAENCRPFFERQLEILRPEFICCLGASAAQTLLKTKFSIGRLRGKFFDYGSAKVLCTYHPAYLLRSPGQKVQVWEDLKLLMAEMGLKLPG